MNFKCPVLDRVFYPWSGHARGAAGRRAGGSAGPASLRRTDETRIRLAPPGCAPQKIRATKDESLPAPLPSFQLSAVPTRSVLAASHFPHSSLRRLLSEP
jgi:hypothetical protein